MSYATITCQINSAIPACSFAWLFNYLPQPNFNLKRLFRSAQLENKQELL